MNCHSKICDIIHSGAQVYGGEFSNESVKTSDIIIPGYHGYGGAIC